MPSTWESKCIANVFSPQNNFNPCSARVGVCTTKFLSGFISALLELKNNNVNLKPRATPVSKRLECTQNKAAVYTPTVWQLSLDGSEFKGYVLCCKKKLLC